ncbi:protein NYNRIN-like [Montipora foliosa]|uniref:protein NYNRIN-like n=1 Tax=Montipora foliosa TaxID=591990 RepID=UPI0035F15743
MHEPENVSEKSKRFPSNIRDRNRNQLITDQKTDVTLVKVRSRVCLSAQKEVDGYYLRNELLIHRKFNRELHNGERYVDHVEVPETYRNEIPRVGHTIPLSGHLGTSKTLSGIAAHFFWPGLHFDVRKYCATCPQCQLLSRKLKSKRAPLKPVNIETQPFKKIAIDIVGELPRTTDYKCILTIVDSATRYPEAIPLQNTSSKAVAGALINYFTRVGYPVGYPEAIPLRNTSSKAAADALINYFTRVGIPDEIVSDQGSVSLRSKLLFITLKLMVQ